MVHLARDAVEARHPCAKVDIRKILPVVLDAAVRLIPLEQDGKMQRVSKSRPKALSKTVKLPLYLQQNREKERAMRRRSQQKTVKSPLTKDAALGSIKALVARETIQLTGETEMVARGHSNLKQAETNLPV